MLHYFLCSISSWGGRERRKGAEGKAGGPVRGGRWAGKGRGRERETGSGRRRGEFGKATERERGMGEREIKLRIMSKNGGDRAHVLL